MHSAPPPWQLAIARIEGALPFISNELAECLALATLRRLWRVHARHGTFAKGPSNPSDEELMLSPHAAERQDFLSWIARTASPALAKAAKVALAAKNQSESVSAFYDVADLALGQLDAILPGNDPVSTLLEWIAASRSDGRSTAWAASLAAAMRPQLFGLEAGPVALAGLVPRSLLQTLDEQPRTTLHSSALSAASDGMAADLAAMHKVVVRGNEVLGGLYASSTAPQAWRLLAGLGPLTRAELARALGVTKRTASRVYTTLEQVGLVRLDLSGKAIIAI